MKYVERIISKGKKCAGVNTRVPLMSQKVEFKFSRGCCNVSATADSYSKNLILHNLLHLKNTSL